MSLERAKELCTVSPLPAQLSRFTFSYWSERTRSWGYIFRFGSTSFSVVFSFICLSSASALNRTFTFFSHCMFLEMVLQECYLKTERETENQDQIEKVLWACRVLQDVVTISRLTVRRRKVRAQNFKKGEKPGCFACYTIFQDKRCIADGGCHFGWLLTGCATTTERLKISITKKKKKEEQWS